MEPGVLLEESLFPDWVSGQPPSSAGVVIAIPVIKQVGFVILGFGGEPEGIEFGQGAGGVEEFDEGG